MSEQSARLDQSLHQSVHQSVSKSGKQVSRNLKVILGAATLSSLALTDISFAAAQTFLGNAAANGLGGSLQVSITVDGGKITAITTPVIPTGSNARYANYAVPILTQEALAAQSATIQGVSGASYITSAWKQSLASAIAKAGSAITTKAVPLPSATPSTTTIAPVLPKSNPIQGFQESDDEQEGHDGNGVKGEGEGSDDGYRARPNPRHSRLSTPKATASALPSLKPGASVIMKSITCVSGKKSVTVRSKKPLCPTGFTLKKK